MPESSITSDAALESLGPAPRYHERPWWACYGVALIACAVAIGVRWTLSPIVADRLPLATMYGAVAIVVWFGGLGPAVLCAVLGYLGCNALFILPRATSAFHLSDAYALALYVISCGLTIAIGIKMRRAQIAAHRVARLALERQRYAERALTERDVAESKVREQFAALREKEELFRALAENVPQLAWMCRPDGSVFWRNRRWVDFTGLTLDEGAAAGWLTVVHPEHVDRVAEEFRRAVAAGVPWEDTFPLRGQDGRYRWFLSRAFPIHDPSGKITRWFGTNTDVTMLRDTQEALRDAQRQVRQYAEGLERTVSERTAKLRETVHELEAFSYSIAHDMRGPLRSMIGYSDILQEDHATELSAPAKHYVNRIAVSARRLDRLIRDVLDYSRIVREQLPIEDVNLGELMGEVLESYPTLVRMREHVHVSGDLPTVRGNRSALTQVLSNLLENALKFVPKLTVPFVRVSAQPGPRTSERNWVRICVEDNGIGIDPAMQPKLFQMFQRFTSGEEYEGTGMGLAIARKALERMGGSIGADSSLGKGSRFWFLLPAAEPSVVDAERRRSESAAPV